MNIIHTTISQDDEGTIWLHDKNGNAIGIHSVANFHVPDHPIQGVFDWVAEGETYVHLMHLEGELPEVVQSVALNHNAIYWGDTGFAA